ncbi:hypothetical protein IW139_004208, partial [Coemansia sp. RSA 353]
SGTTAAHKANSASPRARSRLRHTAAAPSVPVLPPIATLAGSEHIGPAGIAAPVHNLPIMVPSPRPLLPTLRPPYSNSRSGSSAEGFQLPRIRSPQIRSATPIDLPSISRRPHPYLGRDHHHYGHGSSTGLRGTHASGVATLPPPRINTPPQHLQRPYLAPPQHSMRSSPSSAGCSTIASEPQPAFYTSRITPPVPAIPSPQPPLHDNVPSPLRQKLLNGRKAAYGIVLSIPSPITARIAARLGFDWACIDMEHSPQSASIMAEMVEAIASSGTCAPLVRVPSHSSEWIKWAVEAGAHGVIIPNVQSRGQMMQLVSVCRNAANQHMTGASFSAPASIHMHGSGSHSSGSYRIPQQQSPKVYTHPHVSTSPDNLRMSATAASSPTLAVGGDVLVIPQIEYLDAAANSIEEILAVPGVDAAFVHSGRPWSNGRVSPATARDRASSDVLGHMLHISHRLAVPLGTDSVDGSAARMAVRNGFRMVAVGSDVDVLSAAAADQLRLAQTH